ncbi:hypothetical protein GMORB2_3178 [Geosmithia morbida]|uniref:Uncharacterized protein n=1 Tax=Geosmithia morbida TaxID=1094350 RepID=A0A9P5CZE1_9HYPO|nr:uncharacterized protein GMORB2_3178 [Geosmithia morbida]KAF4120377.1 hypothetical protein GMORB2_3178 [Geosmithia morbida]
MTTESEAAAAAAAAAAATTPILTPTQITALFDILTHSQTYAEIESFKYPDAVRGYGHPFTSDTTSSSPAEAEADKAEAEAEVEKNKAETEMKNKDETGTTKTSAPILSTLLNRIALRLPWLRDLAPEFWSESIQGLLVSLAEADLSESYDKGTLGLRKTLATGSSAVVEMVFRGVVGGVRRCGGDTMHAMPSKDGGRSEDSQYDLGSADDLQRAWDSAVQQLVYGDLTHSMFDHMARTSDLQGHSPTIKAASQYTIMHLAAFMHQTFTVSPEGQYLLQLLESVHGLLPYKMIKQTLRVGNAATMINGMLRLLLAKLSVGGITNWVGLTTNADDGMNLLQRIISLVLLWDATEFRKIAERIEKGADSGGGGKSDASATPDGKVLKKIRQFALQDDRSEHEAVRAASLAQSQSIITAILTSSSEPELAASLSEAQHAQCMDYYSALLSVRDRDAITTVLCRQQPDRFTQAVRELVTTYEPFIRMVHQNIDLREHLEGMQGFIDDFIKTCRPKANAATTTASGSGSSWVSWTRGVMLATAAERESAPTVKPPSVEDYVGLIDRNKNLLYRWVHAVAKNCPEVWTELEKWVSMAAAEFRHKDDGDGTGIESRLEKLFRSLPSESDRQSVRRALDSHAAYLSTLSDLSHRRFQQLLDRNSSTGAADVAEEAATSVKVGPGMYLSRWQHLLEQTSISPELPVGPVRTGRQVKHTLARTKAGILGDRAHAQQDLVIKEGERFPTQPDVSVVVDKLGKGFFEMLT